jgi:hypothetical protein
MRALGARVGQVSEGLVVAQVLSALPGAIVGVPLGIALFLAAVHGGRFAPEFWLWVAATVVRTLLAMALLTMIPARIGARQAMAERSNPKRPEQEPNDGKNSSSSPPLRRRISVTDRSRPPCSSSPSRRARREKIFSVLPDTAVRTMTMNRVSGSGQRAVPTDFNPNRAPLVEGPRISLSRGGGAP